MVYIITKILNRPLGPRTLCTRIKPTRYRSSIIIIKAPLRTEPRGTEPTCLRPCAVRIRLKRTAYREILRLSSPYTRARTNKFPPKALATRISSSINVVSTQPALGSCGRLMVSGGNVCDTSRPRSVCGEYRELRKVRVIRLSPCTPDAARTYARKEDDHAQQEKPRRITGGEGGSYS